MGPAIWDADGATSSSDSSSRSSRSKPLAARFPNREKPPVGDYMIYQITSIEHQEQFHLPSSSRGANISFRDLAGADASGAA